MADILEQASARGRKVGRVGVVAVVLFFGVIGGWMAFAPLHGAVVVPATLVVPNYRKTVQHLEGGIVSEIFVRQGEFVKAGQPLLRLSDVQASAVVEMLQDQLDAEHARSARLNAERALQATLSFPDELAARAKKQPKLMTILGAERTLFNARQRQLAGQIAVLRTQIRQIREEIIGLEAELAAANEVNAYLTEELKMNEDLLDKKFVQKTRVMGFKRAVAEKDERRGEYIAEIAKARQKISEAELRIIGLNDAYVKEASGELKESNQKMLDLQERLKPSEDALKRQIVVAPVSGEVVDLKVHTIGGVVAPREPLLDIVPQETTLIVEGKVRTDEIAYVLPNAPVTVQLSAFKQRLTPMIDGKVTYISADTLTDSVNGVPVPFYRIQAALDAKSLQDAGISKLAPGMPAVVFVQTRQRSALDYMVEPVTDSLRKSLREY